jgi:hypothetical protein
MSARWRLRERALVMNVMNVLRMHVGDTVLSTRPWRLSCADNVSRVTCKR